MICDPWIDRAPIVLAPRAYRSSESHRLTSKDRRSMLAAADKCICGPLVGNVGKRGIVHGPVVSDCGRCQRCLDVKNGKSSAS